MSYKMCNGYQFVQLLLIFQTIYTIYCVLTILLLLSCTNLDHNIQYFLNLYTLQWVSTITLFNTQPNSTQTVMFKNCNSITNNKMLHYSFGVYFLFNK